MNLKLIKTDLLDEFKSKINFNLFESIHSTKNKEIPVDYFQFYKSVSSVYSSKIEGEEIDFDSYFKHKFLKVKFKPDYTKKADDLYRAYEFIEEKEIDIRNIKKAHAIISANLLPKNYQGHIRTNPMFVINHKDMIEYVAAPPDLVKSELNKLIDDIELLLHADLSLSETFYFASFLHLVFVKIHPFQDGNGRMARLLEKWFLIRKLGKDAVSIPLEKNYFIHLNDYYAHLKKLGLEYENLDYRKSLDFLLMTVMNLGNIAKQY